MACYNPTVQVWGKFPKNAKLLLAIPQISKKKTAVVLTSLGFYTSTKLGLGADRHDKFCFGFFLVLMGVAGRNRVEDMCQYIPVDPGIHVK